MKKRLDVLLVERGLAPSRQRAQAFILAGNVLVNDRPVSKAGTRFEEEVAIRVKGPDHAFVSRGGLKLEGAIVEFRVPIEGRIAADLGASTGGFTDCLLQRGAAKVFAIDVGYGQLAWKIRQDERVVVMERTNARHLQRLEQAVNLVVGDLSFISLRLILPAIARIAVPGADCLLLVKPQFEAGREAVTKGGRVVDADLRAAAVKSVLDDACALGFEALGQMVSPIQGAKAGNIEHLVHIRTPS
jgi:23S rRNA (cytidine1920-2'-O)/16S rRNA (cytidine1409-2'-O)-methyltransferase